MMSICEPERATPCAENIDRGENRTGFKRLVIFGYRLAGQSFAHLDADGAFDQIDCDSLGHVAPPSRGARLNPRVRVELVARAGAPARVATQSRLDRV